MHANDASLSNIFNTISALSFNYDITLTLNGILKTRIFIRRLCIDEVIVEIVK